MALRLITPPETWPISLAEAQAHCNAPEADFEALLDIYLKAATADAENFTGRAFIDQTWDYFVDAFPADGGAIEIPKPPTIEVLGVFKRSSDGSEETVATNTYDVDLASEPARIVPVYNGSWPSVISANANAVRVRFRAGYFSDDSPPTVVVPFEAKAAILLTTGTLFAHRETIVVGETANMMPWAAEQLLRPLRVHRALA